MNINTPSPRRRVRRALPVSPPPPPQRRPISNDIMCVCMYVCMYVCIYIYIYIV